MRRIFELFYRAEDVLTLSTRETGIGLALVGELARKMNARITVENQNPGAEFELMCKRSPGPERLGERETASPCAVTAPLPADTPRGHYQEKAGNFTQRDLSLTGNCILDQASRKEWATKGLGSYTATINRLVDLGQHPGERVSALAG